MCIAFLFFLIYDRGMKKIIHYFTRGLQYIFRPSRALDIEIERKIVLLNITFFLIWLFLSPYMVIAFSQGKYLLSLFELISMLLMIVLYFYVRHTGDYLTAGGLVSGFLGVLFLFLISDGGVMGSGPLWAYPFPFVALYLQGIKRGSISMAIFFILLLLIFFLPQSPLLMTSYPFDYKIRYLTSMLGVFFLAYFAETIRSYTQQKITAKVDELDKALTSLKITEEERNQLQEELLSAKKIEAIGTLAGGMAHEFNNQVSVILGNTDLLIHQLEHNPITEKKLLAIRSASIRIASLTDQLLSFSRKQILKLEKVNLNHLVKRAQYSLNREPKPHIQVIVEPAPEAFMVVVDPIQIIQVIIELVLNAYDAMAQQEHGKLSITIQNTFFDGTSISDINRRGAFVCLSVSDNGTGMDSQTLNKIYDPFFTTKKAGQGTGLGLSFVYGTVKQHNGWMEVSSQPGNGTTVNIYFPAKTTTDEEKLEE